LEISCNLIQHVTSHTDIKIVDWSHKQLRVFLACFLLTHMHFGKFPWSSLILKFLQVKHAHECSISSKSPKVKIAPTSHTNIKIVDWPHKQLRVFSACFLLTHMHFGKLPWSSLILKFLQVKHAHECFISSKSPKVNIAPTSHTDIKIVDWPHKQLWVFSACFLLTYMHFVKLPWSSLILKFLQVKHAHECSISSKSPKVKIAPC